ncbi:MAG: TonB-dependent receptor [Cyclobacteriaceae bacterium]|nr:TonB-dependent receptor [Cyclobacteriaceae bacterium]
MKKNVITFGLMLTSIISIAQTTSSIEDTLKTQELETVFVRSTRAGENTPVAYTTINKEDIDRVNLGQDLPILLNLIPSMVTTSDAGAGVGYTGMRIRGSDASRINVTINGVPLNDSESQGVYWVNMPDFASTVSSIQVQRGVGTSTNGAGAFGATVNLATNNPATEPLVQINNTYGSFNTRKHNLILNSGLLNNLWAFEGRLSQISSDGYIDRAWSDLKSYYLSGAYYGKKTIVKALAFGGQEETYQAWWGTPESRIKNDEAGMDEVADNNWLTTDQRNNLLNSGRTYNYYEYDNEIDHYQQDHYQLHLSHQLNTNLSFTSALHYTYGRGYYEQYKADEDLQDYGIGYISVGLVDTIKTSDIIRRRWLDNHFGGVTFSLDYSKNKFNSTLGGGYNVYDGDHFGEVIWAEFSGTANIRDKYYDNIGEKQDFNIFWKTNYQVIEKLSLFADLQYRTINYNTFGVDNDLKNININSNFAFFNPKLGATFQIDDISSVYGSFAIGNREPVRNDFIDSPISPKHETLQDIEFGYKSIADRYMLGINLYNMSYKNQLVLTGELNDVGNPVRKNVDKSYRRGIELEGSFEIVKGLVWAANATYSQNIIEKFSDVLYDYGQFWDEYNIIETEYKNADISFSPSLIAGSLLNYSPIKGLSVGLQSKYVGKQYLDNTTNESRAIDSYFVNDLNMNYSFETKLVKEVGVQLLVNNIFNEVYESNGYTFGYSGGGNTIRENYYYPQAGTNLLVSLNLKF